jgi:hypothetical protein
MSKKNRRTPLLLRVFFALMGAGLAIFSWWGWVPARISTPQCQCVQNGAWISVDWTSQPVDEVEIERLAVNMARYEIRYLFPFTTYLREDGSFSSTYDHADEFVAAFRQTGSEQSLLAWIGIPLTNEGTLGIDGTVDLSDESTRQKIVALAVELTEEVGFDGVHLDAETVRSGDESFLLLLEEVKTGIGDRTLSVAGSYRLPQIVNSLPVLERFKWDSEYYGEVAERVDQIATMTYDSGMPLAPLYRLWLREQVRGIGHSLTNSDVELLIGISVSRENTFTHRPWAENLRNGLAGVCGGFERYPEAAGVVDGIAIYAAWETNEADWNLWERWAGNPQ